jgi:hypothetical protein
MASTESLAVRRSITCTVALAILGSFSLIAGCVTRDAYPDYWPALPEVPKSGCADISGRYRNEAIQTGNCFAGTGAYKASWDCDLRLNWALGEPVIAADEHWVEIRQPEPDQIVIVTATEARVLRRSAGDFDCDEDGIVVSEYASIFSKQDQSTGTNATMTAMELLVASGGVSRLGLHFRRAADGSLVAKLWETSSGLLLAIPFHVSSLHYLRWATWADEATGIEAPAAEVPAAEPRP